jgi:hypothetical protein
MTIAMFAEKLDNLQHSMPVYPRKLEFYISVSVLAKGKEMRTGKKKKSRKKGQETGREIKRNKQMKKRPRQSLIQSRNTRALKKMPNRYGDRLLYSRNVTRIGTN